MHCEREEGLGFNPFMIYVPAGVDVVPIVDGEAAVVGWLAVVANFGKHNIFSYL